MKYLIEKITLIRKREGKIDKQFTFDTKQETSDLKVFKERIKKMFSVTGVILYYQEIPDTIFGDTTKEVYTDPKEFDDD